MSTGVPVEAPNLERAAYLSMLAFVAVVQVSIFASELLLAVTGLLWISVILQDRERAGVPKMFWPLLAYAGWTIVSAVFSGDRQVSLVDCKQLSLFLIVPIGYRLLPGKRALAAANVIITIGAISATIGVVEFGILKWDSLGHRPQGVLGMYMTYSGQIMLVACLAAARVLFRKTDRMWAALVMPALLVALAATLSRNAWVGACAGIGLLLMMRDFRLVAVLPVLAAVFIALAPAAVTERLYSTFRLRALSGSSDTTSSSVESNRDRLAMIRSGLHMVRDHPLTGVGPDMVIHVYPQYRDPEAVKPLNPHLHNVPVQIAAERGLPALALWLWFIVSLVRDFVKRRRESRSAWLPTAGLAITAAMLAAGMFEYNFGDSEFLMLFLTMVTLPFAADRIVNTDVPASTHPRAA